MHPPILHTLRSGPCRFISHDTLLCTELKQIKSCFSDDRFSGQVTSLPTWNSRYPNRLEYYFIYIRCSNDDWMRKEVRNKKGNWRGDKIPVERQHRHMGVKGTLNLRLTKTFSRYWESRQEAEQWRGAGKMYLHSRSRELIMDGTTKSTTWKWPLSKHIVGSLRGLSTGSSFLYPRFHKREEYFMKRGFASTTLMCYVLRCKS